MNFPRSKASNPLTLLEQRDAAEKAMQDDFLPVESPDSSPKKTKKRKLAANIPQLDHFPSMTFQKLAVGTKTMCIIKKINSMDAIVSLPFHQHGSCSITEISDGLNALIEANVAASDHESDAGETEIPDLNTLFTVGQLFPCIVLTTSPKIEVSLNPSRINTGTPLTGTTLSCSIKSIQDHGYVVDIGTSINAFMKFPDATRLVVGQLALCTVSKSKSNFVECQPANTALFIKSADIALDLLVPCTRIQGKVLNVVEKGCSVTFGLFTAYIETLHLNNETLKVGQQISPRVLYIEEDFKTIGLTLLPFLLDFDALKLKMENMNSIKTGDFWDAEIAEIQDSALKITDGKSFGLVHNSRLQKSELESGSYSIGSKHKARVVGHDFCDGLIQLSMNPSTLQSEFLSINDVKVGSIVKGVVTKIEDPGISLSFGSDLHTIFGFVPRSQVTETGTKASKYKVGSSITGRVLSVEIGARNNVILTLKKSLLKSTLPVVDKCDESLVGSLVEGYISAIKPFGLLIGFYSNIIALAPASELSEFFVKDPESLFSVGQVVKSRVISVDLEKKRITVSIKRAIAESLDPNIISQINLGDISKAKILTILDASAIVELIPLGVKAKLPIQHVSDHQSNVQSVFSMLKASQIVDVIILECDFERNSILVSMKPLMLLAAREETKSKTAAKYTIGYIKNCIPSRCFIGTTLDKKVTCNVKNVSESFIQNLATYFTPGQTVLGAVIEENPESMEVSLKQSAVSFYRQYFRAFAHDFFKQQENYQRFQLAKKSDRADWHKSFKIGSVIDGVIEQRTPFGYIVSLPNTKAEGIIYTIGSSETLKPATKVKCQIIDVDVSKGIFDLKLLSDTPSIGKNLELYSNISATIEVVKSDYIIFSVPHCASVCYAILRNLNSSSSAPVFYQIGQKVPVTVLKIGTEGDYTAQRTLCTIESQKIDYKSRRILKDPIDPAFKVIEDCIPGKIIKGIITSSKNKNLIVKICSNFEARVHVSRIPEGFEYENQKTYEFMILGTSIIQGPLVITHRNSISRKKIELSLLPDDLAGSGKPPIKLSDLNVGDVYSGTVAKIQSDSLWCDIGPFCIGRVPILEVSYNIEHLKNLLKFFKVGGKVNVLVLSKNEEKSSIEFSVRAANSSQDNISGVLSFEKIQIGMKLPCKIVKVSKSGISVKLATDVMGRIPLSDICAEYVEDPASLVSQDGLVEVTVIGKTKFLELSLLETRRPEILADAVVSGYVKNISNHGAFVDLGNSITARVKITEICDEFVKDWKSLLKEGQLVKGRILSMDNDTCEMSLKKSKCDPNVKTLTMQDLSVGMKISGVISAIKPNLGAFIKISGCDLKGLCHVSELSDIPVSDISSLYSVGDTVKAVILKIDEEKKRLSFGLKASYFDANDAMEEDDQDSEDQVKEDETSHIPAETPEIEVQSVEDDSESEAGSVENEESANNERAIISDEEDALMGEASESDSNEAPLDLGDAKWGEDISESEQEVESEQESEEESPAQQKKSKRAKKRAKKEEENRIAKQEMSLLEATAPDNVAGYERALLGSPNSSFLWIKFMAFFLQMAEIDKAREVGERAIKAIAYREVEERTNVWVALLNLENSFGDQKSLAKMFERAVSYNDPKAMYLQLASIYERANNDAEFDSLFAIILKKFKGSCKVWVSYGSSLLKRGNVVEARKVLQRSLQSLPKRKHIKVASQFAQLEYKNGDIERGRTLFEGIIANHPKRLDMWSIYLDMEIRKEENENARKIFERVVTCKFSSKKMKFLFKKYLDFEKNLGNEEGVEHVKALAMDYVERVAMEE